MTIFFICRYGQKKISTNLLDLHINNSIISVSLMTLHNIMLNQYSLWSCYTKSVSKFFDWYNFCIRWHDDFVTRICVMSLLSVTVSTLGLYLICLSFLLLSIVVEVIFLWIGFVFDHTYLRGGFNPTVFCACPKSGIMVTGMWLSPFYSLFDTPYPMIRCSIDGMLSPWHNPYVFLFSYHNQIFRHF